MFSRNTLYYFFAFSILHSVIYIRSSLNRFTLLRANALRRLARRVRAGVSNTTSATRAARNVSGPGQERISTLVVVQNALLLQEANRVGQPFSELGELSTIEVGLAEPDIVDDRLNTSLGGLSELDLDGTVAGSSVNSKAVSFNEDGDVVGASSGHAEAVDVSQSSSEAVVANEEVREEHILVEDFNHLVSVASSV